MYFVEEVELLEKGRRKIRFDNGMEILLYKGEAGAHDLKEGIEISKELYDRMLHEVVGKRAKKRALHLLERQDRTEHQLREKLRQNAYPDEVIEEALAYVRSYHYIDDFRYACNYIRGQKERKSRRRLQQDLLRKGISRELIEKALEQEGSGDETESIRRHLEKKGYCTDMTRQEANKIYQSLLRKGYRSSDILYVMRSEYLT